MSLRTRVIHAALAVACCATGAAAQSGSLEGYWEGLIVYEADEFDLELTIEVAREATGRLVGTLDVPTQRMRFHPLSVVQLDGTKVLLEFRRHSEARGPDAPFTFHGELQDGGRAIRGEFVGWYHDGRNRVPFHLVRTGEAGRERPEPPTPPLTPLSGAGPELAAAFNRDADAVRLVMLLSPT